VKHAKVFSFRRSFLGLALSALFVFNQVNGQSSTLGKIDFPTSGAPAAQKHFGRTVCLESTGAQSLYVTAISETK